MFRRKVSYAPSLLFPGIPQWLRIHMRTISYPVRLSLALTVCWVRAIVNRNCWELSLHTKVLHLQGKYPQCNQGCTQQTMNQISRYRDICICYSLHSSTEYRHNAVKVRLIQHPHCRGSPNNPRCDLPEFRSSSNMLLSQRSLPDVLQIVGQAVRINLNCVQLRNIRTYLNKICIKIYHKQSNENRGRM